MRCREAARGQQQELAEGGAGDRQLSGVINFDDGSPASTSPLRPARLDPERSITGSKSRRSGSAPRVSPVASRV
jgi:hypothetical protein